MNELEDFAWTTLLLREFQMLRCLKVNMLRQLIIPTFVEEGYFNLRPFDLVEDLHEIYYHMMYILIICNSYDINDNLGLCNISLHKIYY